MSNVQGGGGFIIVQLDLQKPLLLILRYRRRQPKQLIITQICSVEVVEVEVEVEVLHTTYPVSGATLYLTV